MHTATRLARIGSWLLLVAALLRTPAAAEPAAGALSQRNIKYDIDATYDRAQQTIQGSETIHWTNHSQHAANELQFHLYLNAFANNRSTFMRQIGDDWEEWNERD